MSIQQMRVLIVGLGMMLLPILAEAEGLEKRLRIGLLEGGVVLSFSRGTFL